MAIQHKSIPDIFLHEPKGVASAAAGTTYLADGAGSGQWQKLSTDNISGFPAGDVAADKMLVTGGGKTVAYREAYIYGGLVMESNSAPISLTAVADASLNTAGQYTLMAGAGSPLVGSGLEYGVEVQGTGLKPKVNGVYELVLCANIATYPTAAAKVGFKYRINGNFFSTRKWVSGANANGGQVFGQILLNLTANDVLQMYVASTTTGNLIISDASVSLKMIRNY